MATRKKQSVYCVRRHMRRVGAAGKESYRRKLSAISRALDFLGQKEVVTAAHNACIREMLQEIDVHGKADRHMKLLTLEGESSLGSLWDQEQCVHSVRSFARRRTCGKQRKRRK